MLQPYSSAPTVSHRGTAMWIAGLVFCVGTGLGYAWRQNLLEVELLPAQTGVIDPHVENREQDPLAPVTAARPLAEFAGGLPETSHENSAAAVNDPQIFQQQSEPIEDSAFPPESRPTAPAAPARISESVREAALLPMEPPQRFSRAAQNNVALATGNQGAIQPASFAETADEFPAASGQENPSSGAVATSGLPASESATNRAEPVFERAQLPELLADYDQKIEQGETLAAHRLLSQVYWKAPDLRPEIQERLDRSATAIFFLPQPHFVEPYVIEPGDRLESIANQYKISWEYLSRCNRVDPRRIQAGRRLKVIRGPFSAVVELTDFSLTVHLQGYYVRRFPVGIGREGASPIGKFSVLNKVVNPQYTDPDGRVISGDDPANPLGERWLDLGGSYGIHGTTEPESIGQAASRGCIRLNDVDVVAVYDFLTVGSEVVIRK